MYNPGSKITMKVQKGVSFEQKVEKITLCIFSCWNKDQLDSCCRMVLNLFDPKDRHKNLVVFELLANLIEQKGIEIQLRRDLNLALMNKALGGIVKPE